MNDYSVKICENRDTQRDDLKTLLQNIKAVQTETLEALTRLNMTLVASCDISNEQHDVKCMIDDVWSILETARCIREATFRITHVFGLE